MSTATDDTQPARDGGDLVKVVDKSAHKRLDTLEREMRGELHGPAGQDGLKTKVSKLGDDLRRVEDRMEAGFNELLAAVHANQQPAWVWPLTGAAIAVGIGGLVYLIGTRVWGW